MLSYTDLLKHLTDGTLEPGQLYRLPWHFPQDATERLLARRGLRLEPLGDNQWLLTRPCQSCRMGNVELHDICPCGWEQDPDVTGDDDASDANHGESPAAFRLQRLTRAMTASLERQRGKA